MEELQTLWEKVLNKIQNNVSAISYDLWIATIEVLDFKDSKTLILVAGSTSAKNQLLRNHYEKLKSAICEVFGSEVELEILDKQEKEVYLSNNPTQANVAEAKKEEQSIFNEKYTFDNFVIGKSNQFCYAAAKAVAENPGKAFNPLFIYGGVGLGKTHLLHAIGNYIHQQDNDKKIKYVTCEQFTNDYIQSLGVVGSGKEKATLEFRDKYRNVDILMVDDIQFISNKISTQEEFFHTFNDLYQNNKQIIISSDRHPKEIATLEDRLKSRCLCGLTQDIQQPDYETRIAILRKKVQMEKYFIQDNVIEYIAEKLSTNVREMEGVLTKIHFFASLSGKRVADLGDAKQVLRDEEETHKEAITADSIIDTVCDFYKISKSDIVGKKKSKDVVEPRMIAIYLIDEILDIPLVSIGKIFGGRDHTTIMHSRDKICEQLKVNNATKELVNNIKSRFTQ